MTNQEKLNDCKAFLGMFENTLDVGFQIAEKIDFEYCYAFHSGGGHTHLFLQLKDKNVVVIHFMEICIEVIDNSKNLSLSDFIDNEEEIWGYNEPIKLVDFIASEYFKTIQK